MTFLTHGHSYSFAFRAIFLLLFNKISTYVLMRKCVSVSMIVFAAEVNFNESCWLSKSKHWAAEDQVQHRGSQRQRKKRKMATRESTQVDTGGFQNVRNLQLQQSFITSANADAYMHAVSCCSCSSPWLHLLSLHINLFIAHSRVESVLYRCSSLTDVCACNSAAATAYSKSCVWEKCAS